MRTLFLVLIFVFCTFLSFAQKGEASKINSFHFKSGEIFDVWYYLDSSYVGRRYYMQNPGRFFDSLGVIHLNWALEIAQAERFIPFYAELIASETGNGRLVWRMEAEPKYKYNSRGLGNATVKREILVIDAKSGAVLERVKEKHRALVDF